MCRLVRISFLTILAGIVFLAETYAQTEADSVAMNLELREVTVGAAKFDGKEQVDANDIDMNEKEDVAEALNLLPGVLNVRGAKSDMVYVHGFDQRQIPVYYDGIPIYIPYDGILDLDMLMVSDIKKISIASSSQSLLYGPNALGGAINIVTSRPDKGLSGTIKSGTFTNGAFNGLASIGYGADKYYIKAGYSIIDRNDFRLSDDYRPTSSLEDGGDLENSYKKTAQLSLKAGFTPSPGHEYAISYVKHDGEKGISPYLGSNGSSRFWQFPVYDKESIYFLSNSKLSPSFALRTRLYYDQFDNTLESYDDSTYTSQTKGYAFTSIYDDYSLGAIATLSFFKGASRTVFDAQYKYDDHKEHNVGDPVVQMTDKSAALSLVENYSIDKFLLHGGVSMNYEKGIKAEYLDENDELAEYPENSNTLINGEVGASWKLSASHELKAGISYKTRFPTMKDRYSMRLGKSLANPDLNEENALNYSLGYSGAMADKKIKIDLSTYYSSLKDAIIEVYGVNPDDPSVFQLQNTGEAEYFGTDIRCAWSVTKPLSLQASYAFVKRNNLTDPDVKFTDVPEHTVHAAFIYRFKNNSYVNFNTETYSDRYTTSDGTEVDGFTLANVKGAFYLYRDMVRAEAGMNNIFDKNYQVEEGYPMPGRNWFVSLFFQL